jgi:hypothetical protein
MGDTMNREHYGKRQGTFGTFVVRTAVLGALVSGAGYLAATSVGGLLGMAKQEKYTVAPGSVDPAHVRVIKAVKNGGVEAQLKYSGPLGDTQLPIIEGMNGPLAGDADYYWNNITTAVKSRLVGESWKGLGVETRKGIVTAELETLLQNYK